MTSTEQPIRIGIIGAGGIVKSRHMPGLRAIPNVQIVQVTNRSLASAEAFCREFAPEARATLGISDAERVRAKLEAAERTMLADAPIVPIYFYASKHLVKPHVDGWQDNILDWHYSKDLQLRAR